MANKQKELDLLKVYRKTARRRTGPDLIHAWYTPGLILAVIGLAVWGGILLGNRGLSGQISETLDWLSDPQVVDQYYESRQKQAYNEGVLRDIREVEALTGALDTYPQVDRALVAQIRAAGGAQVDMALTGYDAASGLLSFEARSAQVIDIPGYVLSLQDTGLFDTVRYTGYEYDDGTYILSLSCTLAAKDGGEEAAS